MVLESKKCESRKCACGKCVNGKLVSGKYESGKCKSRECVSGKCIQTVQEHLSPFGRGITWAWVGILSSLGVFSERGRFEVFF